MEFYIDFQGYVCVEAKSKEEAEYKFWESFIKHCHKPFSDDVWEIVGIEQKIS